MHKACLKKIPIILIDDDDVDVLGIKRAFKQCQLYNPIFRARDGLDALSMLRQSTEKTSIKKPYIIILDINMPRMNGFEFLKELRNDPDLKPTIVFVLTTSKQEKDKLEAYKFNVAGFIQKTDQYHGFTKVITMIDSYWRVVEFP